MGDGVDGGLGAVEHADLFEEDRQAVLDRAFADRWQAPDLQGADPVTTPKPPKTPKVLDAIADAVLAVAGLALLPRMEQFRGETSWLKPFGNFKSWIRLIRVRTLRVRNAAVRITNGRHAQGEPTAPSSGSLLM